MPRPLRSERSTEAPMDFQFTSRPSTTFRPAWAADEPGSPLKRTHSEMSPPPDGAFPAPSQSFPTFGTNSNVPFLFNTPPPHTPHAPAWAPPAQHSPTKPYAELADIDMAELSPPKPEEKEKEKEKESEGGRSVAVGAMRRVFKSRQGARERLALKSTRRRADGEDEDASSGSENESDDGRSSPRKSRVQNLSHHYTLNVPSPAAPHTDTPYVLLGYLQFFFNLSLILLFLYLVLQFILTVQRDVEQRISEYSMDIVQEISNCAIQFKTNLCGTGPVPAMAFTLTSLAFLTVFINALLSLYRSRHQPAPTAPPLAHQPSFALPAAAPFAPQYLQAPAWGSNWHGVGEEDGQNAEPATTAGERRRREDDAEKHVAGSVKAVYGGILICLVHAAYHMLHWDPTVTECGSELACRHLECFLQVQDRFLTPPFQEGRKVSLVKGPGNARARHGALYDYAHVTQPAMQRVRSDSAATARQSASSRHDGLALHLALCLYCNWTRDTHASNGEWGSSGPRNTGLTSEHARIDVVLAT
ncbi:hypothetical protein EVG20_g10082 [Dentipellis fragilis]|uniref:Brl1/Brr6 domain-containing protein n=1 Tax=Dentipellis fragilis TaxID=205917 RepID=A0A4Y9XT97_9AGAM|nr:hypothetical protein EVG20_g10082 [Dentipellis fragilis]